MIKKIKEIQIKLKWMIGKQECKTVKDVVIRTASLFANGKILL